MGYDLRMMVWAMCSMVWAMYMIVLGIVLYGSGRQQEAAEEDVQDIRIERLEARVDSLRNLGVN